MERARALLVALLLAWFGIPAEAQAPSLKTVVDRMGVYIQAFDQRMATIVADEQYRQTLDADSDVNAGARRRNPSRQTRVLRSDYALVRGARRDEWVGFRDTFEVDGKPVRDHDSRLQQMVADGALAAAARVANESARFNLGSEFLVRNINVPTFVLHILAPANRDRFSFKKGSEETVSGVHTWRIDYRERDRPTIVRTYDGHDQPSSGSAWVDPQNGEIWRTTVEWAAGRGQSLGRITVTYGRVPGVDTLVPVAMSEHYEPRGGTLEGEATYSNFRQFKTAARVVAP